MGQQYSHLSSEERILIEKLHCEQHLSVRKIAEEIGRDKSTVSRELRRGLWFASNECVCSIESGPCERVDVFHVSGRFWSTSACGEKRTPARPAWTSFPS